MSPNATSLSGMLGTFPSNAVWPSVSRDLKHPLLGWSCTATITAHPQSVVDNMEWSEFTLKRSKGKREFETNRAGTMHSRRSHERGTFRMYLRQGTERQLTPDSTQGKVSSREVAWD